MNFAFNDLNEKEVSRMEVLAYNFENPDCRKDFLEKTSIDLKVPFSEGLVEYEPVKKVSIGISRLGTAKAVAIGAYTFALNELSVL
jgi:glucokinase